MIEFFTTIFAGGATGLFGSVVGRLMSIWEIKDKRKFILEKYKLDAQLRAQETESELKIISAKTSLKAMEASYDHDKSLNVTSSYVNNIRALVRPILTALLWFLVALVWFTMPLNMDYQKQIINTVLYAASTATFWWFGDRGYQKKN